MLAHADTSRRFPRRMRRFAGVAAVVVTCTAIGGAAGVLAATTFTDVPLTHPFHDEIAEASGACLAGGYADGGYHPADAVTRQAMAAFLSRAGSDVAYAENLAIGQFGAGDGFSTVEEITRVEVEVPNVPGCTQWVVLHGQVDLYSLGLSADTCTPTGDAACRGVVDLYEEIDGSSTMRAAVVTSLRDDYASEAVDVMTALELTPGRHIFWLGVRAFDVNADAAYYDQGRLLATVVPFGHTGMLPPP